MKSFVPASGFVIAFAALSIVVACSSSEADKSSSSSSSNGGPSDKAPDDCVTQCTAQASGCGQDSSQCSQLCSTITGTQFACVKAAGCDQDTASDCLKTGGDSGTGGPNGDSGSGVCIGLGKPGCNSHNSPSNCCTDSTHPSVSCNANNDGKGTAQCCVNTGKTCVDSSDCCGNATNPQIYKCCPDKKCGSC